MKHLGTIKIHTDRLTLRPFTMGDATMMFSNWANDDDVTRYVPWNSHGSIEVTKEILTEWTNGYKNPNFYEWCIEYNGEAIGNIDVIEIDEELKKGKIGYCLSKKYWRKGITSEALLCIKNFLINEVRFEHLWACHHIGNPNSGLVLVKCGFHYVCEVDDCEKYMNMGSKVVIYEY